MMDICEKYNLDLRGGGNLAARTGTRHTARVSILPQVEQTHGESRGSAHPRRIFATIRIKDWGTDELTTTHWSSPTTRTAYRQP